MSFQLPRVSLAVFATALAAASLFASSTAVADGHGTPLDNIEGSDGVVLKATALETFNRPWAMSFLPDGKAVVTEKGGALWLLNDDGKKAGAVDNAPSVDMRGQGGMGDFIVHPDFADNGTVFLSYIERDANDDALSGAVVERATLSVRRNSAALSNREIIWRQSPKLTGNGHYSHRLAVSPDGHLFITSGDRQHFNPSQNMAMTVGKIVRINQDGSVPESNPFYANGGVTAQIWTLGHRNPLGLAFDADGQLWAHEMGPAHGDELNRIVRSSNYGYPFVSEGDHYDGTKIPDHASMPVFTAPAIAWVPAISPAGLIFYRSGEFADWDGNALIGGLSSRALVRVSLVDGEDSRGRPKTTVTEAARYEWGSRVREVEQDPDGALYVLEDGEGGRLIRLEPLQ